MPSGIGPLVKAWRTERKLSLRDVALRSGVGKSTLSRWESGNSLPRLTELDLVLEALHASPAQREAALAQLDAPRTLARLRGETPAPLARVIGPLPSGGDLYRAMRIRRGMVLESVANALGVSPATVSRWECGVMVPPVEQRAALFDLLGALTQERRALSEAPLLLAPPMAERMASPGTVRDLLDKIYAENWAGAPINNWVVHPLNDLRFLTLEALLWPIAGRRAWGQRFLAEVFAMHAYYLCIHLRFREAERYGLRALDVMPENSLGSAFHLGAEAVVARSAVYRQSQRAAPERGLSILQARLQAAKPAPLVSSWMHADIATYRAMAGDFKGALDWIRLAENIAEHIGDERLVQERGRDRGRILLWGHQPERALELLNPHQRNGGFGVDAALLQVEALIALGDRRTAAQSLDRAFDAITSSGIASHKLRAHTLGQALQG